MRIHLFKGWRGIRRAQLPIVGHDSRRGRAIDDLSAGWSWRPGHVIVGHALHDILSGGAEISSRDLLAGPRKLVHGNLDLSIRSADRQGLYQRCVRLADQGQILGAISRASSHAGCSDGERSDRRDHQPCSPPSNQLIAQTVGTHFKDWTTGALSSAYWGILGSDRTPIKKDRCGGLPEVALHALPGSQRIGLAGARGPPPGAQ